MSNESSIQRVPAEQISPEVAAQIAPLLKDRPVVVISQSFNRTSYEARSQRSTSYPRYQSSLGLEMLGIGLVAIATGLVALAIARHDPPPEPTPIIQVQP